MISQKNEEIQLESIRSFYDTQYYKNLDPIKKAPSTHLRRLAKKIGIQKDDCVLDIACGTGEWLSACNEIDAHISGIDLSKKQSKLEKLFCIMGNSKFVRQNRCHLKTTNSMLLAALVLWNILSILIRPFVK